MDFVEHQPVNIQIGVVAFSDSGFSVQKPTYDHDTILASIKRLSPQRGTSLAQGIYSSLNVLAACRLCQESPNHRERKEVLKP